MKRSENQLPSEANFSTFLQFNDLIKNCVKGYRVTKIVKGIKFEGTWGELEAEQCFQRQSFTKDLRLPLVFM